MSDDFALFKEEVKARTDIVDIIGEYIELKKRGSNYIGLCPFHTEKTPSFNVRRDGQFYHCFGCGQGGDVISFLMDITGMSFMEALEHLANRAGLTMPERKSRDTAARDTIDHIMAANMAAAEFYHATLQKQEGETARGYLESRGLTPETIRSYRLGYAPGDPAPMVAFAKTKSVAAGDLEDAGIIGRSRYGHGYYHRFAERVMFPIVDQAARIIGFGGRLLEGEGAKYLNSPESAVYHKSRVLFGIHQAKKAIKQKRHAIVVEGYMDVLTLHQAGMMNVIAASGTSFTTEQGRMISRMTRDVVLLFDGDTAGIKAASRGADALIESDLHIRVVVLPGGHDPDSFVREKGAEALTALVDEAPDIWQFKLGLIDQDAASTEEKLQHAGEIADAIARMTDDLKREMFIRDMATHLRIDHTALQRAVDGRIRRKVRTRQREGGTPAEQPVSTHDQELLAAIIHYPDLARHYMEEAGSKPFSHAGCRYIADEIFHRIVEGLDISPSALMGSLEDRQAQKLVASLAVIDMPEKTAARRIEHSLKNHKYHELKREVAELADAIRGEKDAEKRTKLAQRQHEVKQQLRHLTGGVRPKKKY